MSDRYSYKYTERQVEFIEDTMLVVLDHTAQLLLDDDVPAEVVIEDIMGMVVAFHMNFGRCVMSDGCLHDRDTGMGILWHNALYLLYDPNGPVHFTPDPKIDAALTVLGMIKHTHSDVEERYNKEYGKDSMEKFGEYLTEYCRLLNAVAGDDRIKSENYAKYLEIIALNKLRYNDMTNRELLFMAEHATYTVYEALMHFLETHKGFDVEKVMYMLLTNKDDKIRADILCHTDDEEKLKCLAKDKNTTVADMAKQKLAALGKGNE